ncbi:MAG: V-type ATP synthase subunit A [Lentimicrobium sp.]|jgi:V/A-type H+-transporting ATPase subunit A|nr:V-type ATP synthase subunit A [Lentimicrobium sp.]MDD2527103.1 V-type ATP synthase subunit A [Lentimicrobiaceae bacterium]MDD4597858.1 V-type ATP synthase subunit A [Lentimicrobiaceae bacterium]MDY0025034.1 V-type ATP synthase subunit A [Lentimicrobium sp.]
MEENKLTTGTVTGIIANLVIVEADGPVSQNEICFINLAGVRMMAEVIKVLGNKAYTQVFESTRGLKVGETAEFMGHMLEVTLGPGILSKNFDGLQNNLDTMKGTFLRRGEYTDAFDYDQAWDFTPLAKAGDIVVAGDWLGEVKENWIGHKIMVPFKLEGKFTIKSINGAGTYKASDTIAILTGESDEEVKVTMLQKWPVKIPIKGYVDKPRPFRLMETGVRIIDTMNPMAEGGTGFIPGPFGSGKTVLQHALSKQAEADLIIMAACGERANEVVEIFTEFPELEDPRTGRKLMERTTIIANTSNMPVAAREASVYTAMTIGEYYRAMGLKVLLLADSTSRWAQALREMSNRMEELPGPDAFPMDLPAIISSFYARAGYVNLRNGAAGSITFIGTVSPAGGNLKEPVTESTKKVARCFYALSQQRADSKRYPAVDPIDSYSKYLEYPELQEYLAEHITPGWLDKVLDARNILLRGREVYEQINILGDDGVPIDYHLRYWKSEVIDFVILQQDAFDDIDASTPIERQRKMLIKVLEVCHTDFDFESFEAVNPYFKRIINVFKQMNYSEYESEDFNKYEAELEAIINERKVA